MRVVFDAHWWSEGPPSARMVLKEVVHTWTELFPRDDVHVVTTRETKPSDLPSGVTVHLTRFPIHALTAALSTARVARSVRADAVFSHNFTPILGRTRAIFLHDVLFRTNPEWFTLTERAYFAAMAPLARLRADVVMTSSESECHRIRLTTRIRNPIATGLAVGSDLAAADAEPIADLADASFVLAVGRLNKRKNLASLLEAAADLPQRPAVVVVGEAEGRRETLSDRAQSAIDSGTIRMLGSVSDGQLRWLYEHARALAFPSLDEGFGLPAIEALHFGCPVILSDVPVFREVAKNHARFVSPTDRAGWRAAIQEALDVPSRAPGSLLPADSPYNWPRVVSTMREALSLSGERRGKTTRR